MALLPQPPGLNLCPILKDQPSSPNRLDLVVAVQRETMQADDHRCRTVSADTSDN
jgi:hypothetical protein